MKRFTCILLVYGLALIAHAQKNNGLARVQL